MKTVYKLIEYYGHWSQGLVLIGLEAMLEYLQVKSGYQIGKFAEDATLQNEGYRAQVAKLVMIVLSQALFQITKERLMKLLLDKTMKKVHQDVVDRIMKAPVNLFFDVTPNGSIMRRFTEDMGTIENIVHCAMHCVCMCIEIASMFYIICQ